LSIDGSLTSALPAAGVAGAALGELVEVAEVVEVVELVGWSVLFTVPAALT
jgi:hypothetical protein